MRQLSKLLLSHVVSIKWILVLALVSSVANASPSTHYLVHTGPNGYPPFIFVHEQASAIHYSGVIVDLLDAFEAENPEFSREYNSMSRTRANLHIERGDFSDLMFFSEDFASPKTKKKYQFTHPLFSSKDIVVTRADSPLEYRKPADLHGKSVATLRGYAYGEFDRLFKLGIVESVALERHTQGIEMLERNRVDAYFGNMLVTPFYLKQIGLEQAAFKFSDIPLSEITFSFMIHRDKSELFNALNAFIRKAEDNGALQKMLNHYIK